jgi:hypothetical protein
MNKGNNMKTKKGLLVHVLRSVGDCTNGGVTTRYEKFVLVGEGVAEIFAPSEDAPELQLGRRGDYIYAVPTEEPKGSHMGPMSGGNFIYTSDSRFPSRQPIAVHDRFETPEQYEALSR